MSFPRYPKYKASGVEWLGEVPQHWKLDRMKWSTRSCKNGIWGEEAKQDENDIPCVRVADFDRQRLRVALDEPTIRNVSASERVGRVLRQGDLLLEKSGGGEGQPVGCVVLYDDPKAAVCSNFVAKVEVAPGMNSSFWRYLHAAAYSIRLNTRSIKQTSGIQNLDQQQYLDEIAAFPPETEQTKIASFLDRETSKINGLVGEQRRLIELLKEKRQAVISHAVTKGLNPHAPLKPSGIEWLGDVPEHWESKKLRFLFRQQKRQDQEGKAVLSVYRDYGVIRKDSRDDNMNKTPDDLSVYQLVNRGDLVVNKMKAWQGSLGVSDLEGITSPDYVVFSPLHRECASFLHLLLRSDAMVSVYRFISNGIRPAQWRLEPEQFLNLLVFLPPICEQEAVVSHVIEQISCFDALNAKAERGIELLQERRTALISAAVTGQIDVRGVAETEDV